MNLFKSSAARLLKILYPNRCEFCGEVIELKDTVCGKCRYLPVIEPPFCKYCGVNKEACKCDKKTNEYKAVIAPYYYKNNVQNAIYSFKFRNMPFLSERMGADIAKCVKKYYNQIDFDAVCFVPLYPSSDAERGYNQAQLLAQKAAEEIEVELRPLLKKTIKNKVQHKQTAKQRKANVFGVYDLTDKEWVKDKTILLIDDVKTTGCTLNECSKMLKIYGAKEVYCAVLAIVNYSGK